MTKGNGESCVGVRSFSPELPSRGERPARRCIRHPGGLAAQAPAASSRGTEPPVRSNAVCLIAEGRLDAGELGGFNWSSQHLEHGGADGRVFSIDDCIDGAIGDEVAGSAVALAGSGARVLA